MILQSEVDASVILLFLWTRRNCKLLFTMRLVWLCLDKSQDSSKVRFETCIHGEEVFAAMYSWWNCLFQMCLFSLSLNCLLFSFCSSKEPNEEAGPKGERGRNPLGTPMPPNRPSQGTCGSWTRVGSSCERRGRKSLSQRSPGCWAMSGANCLLRRNGYHYTPLSSLGMVTVKWGCWLVRKVAQAFGWNHIWEDISK